MPPDEDRRVSPEASTRRCDSAAADGAAGEPKATLPSRVPAGLRARERPRPSFGRPSFWPAQVRPPRRTPAGRRVRRRRCRTIPGMLAPSTPGTWAQDVLPRLGRAAGKGTVDWGLAVTSKDPNARVGRPMLPRRAQRGRARVPSASCALVHLSGRIARTEEQEDEERRKYEDKRTTDAI